MPANKSAEGQARVKQRKSSILTDKFNPGLYNRMPRRTWTEVADEVSHIADYEGHITQFQVTARAAVLTVEIPLNYAHDIVMLQQQGALSYFFRAYVPPLPPIFAIGEMDELDLSNGSPHAAED